LFKIGLHVLLILHGEEKVGIEGLMGSAVGAVRIIPYVGFIVEDRRKLLSEGANKLFGLWNGRADTVAYHVDDVSR
jgi:hypothetical protein